jgi:P27 family predicted phage terminase small subunit
MARPRKPTNLKIIQGTYRKSRENPNEPQPKICIPEPPEFLNDKALEEWHRIAPELKRLGLLSQVDCMALAGYCAAVSRLWQAEEQLKSEGLTVTNERGRRIKNPLVDVANAAAKQISMFASQFGMSPATRANVKPDKTEEKEHPLAKFKR